MFFSIIFSFFAYTTKKIRKLRNDRNFEISEDNHKNIETIIRNSYKSLENHKKIKKS